MSKFPKFMLATALLGLTATPLMAEKLGLGRAATADEVAAWDLDIFPDGSNLPEGSGDVFSGEELFADYCAVCHGDFAEGVDNWPKLAGGADTLDHEDPLKTVGSYWPYLSTSFDYVRRSMPFGNAQTLSNDEVYAIVAYILYSNDLVDDDFVLSNETFTGVELPNAEGFILDDRAETEYPIFIDRCMEGCKDSVEITMRAAVLDVTPEETKARAIQAMVEATNPRNAPTKAAKPVEVAPEPVPVEEPVVEEVVEVTPAELDADLVKAGEKVFKKCKACHKIGEGAKNGTGPMLTGIWGRAAGAIDGFKYSKPMLAAAEGGLVWDEAALTGYLTNPRKYMKGTKMSFSGLKKDKDIAAILEFLKSHSQ